ncbi:MAG: hypothetical protein E7157_01890 [Lactobacillales bacterium]|nr:hypothetical protein [Lactobacillales bacterium]
MKRLLRVSLDAAIFSFIPIISWFLLGILVDENLINVFSLTYPIQFIYALMKSIFGVGANISKEKDKDKNVVMSGIVLGIIIGFIVFGFIAINIDSYINFMNMDPNIYHTFGLYSVIQLYIQLIFALILEKLYYEEKNKLANIYTIILNLLNFVVLIVSSLIFKNQTYIIITTLLSILICVVIMLIREFDKFKFNINIIKCIKYDSVDIVNNIFFFIIFLFGLSNAIQYGQEYMMALNFVALITDTQWDAFDAISTVAKIDISKGKFNYLEHRKNGYKLLVVILLSVFLMFIIMWNFYTLDIKLTFIYLAFELVNFMIYPIYRLKTCFLQLEYSAIKITSNKFVASTLRTFLSFLKTPFCTGIGQCCSSIYQFITTSIIFKLNYKVNKKGYIEKIIR